MVIFSFARFIMPTWYSTAGDAGLQAGMERANSLSPVFKPSLFCVFTLLSSNNSLGLYGGVGVIDCLPPQAYNISDIMAPYKR